MSILNIIGRETGKNISSALQIKDSLKASELMTKLGNPAIENYWAVGPQSAAATISSAVGNAQGGWRSALFGLGLEFANNALIIGGIPLMLKLFNQGVRLLKLPEDVKNNINMSWFPTSDKFINKYSSFEPYVNKRYLTTNKSTEIFHLLNASRLIFSMAVVFFLLGMFIPWLYFKQNTWFKPQDRKINPNSTFPNKATTPSSTIQSPKNKGIFQNKDAFQNFIMRKNRVQSYPASPANSLFRTPVTVFSRSHAHPKDLKFGSLAGRLYGGLNEVGYFMENTTFGDIMANDACATGGEVLINKKHTLFNAIQVIANNLSDLCFFVLFVPTALKLMDGLFQKYGKLSTALDPKVAKAVHEEILKQVDPKNVSYDQIKEIIKTNHLKDLDAYQALQPYFIYYLKTADSNRFLKLFNLEGEAYLGKEHWQSVLKHHKFEDLFKEITPKNSSSKITLNSIGLALHWKLLKQQTYSSPEEARAVEAALQFAFAHTGGISKAELMRTIQDKKLDQELEEKDFEALKKRIDKAIQYETWNSISSMFRRGIVFTQNILGASHPTIQQAEKLSAWLEQASLERNPLDQLAIGELEDIILQLKNSGAEKRSGVSQGIQMLHSFSSKKAPFSFQAFNQLQSGLKNSLNWQHRVVARKLENLQILFKDGETLKEGIASNVQSTFSHVRMEGQKRPNNDSVEALLKYYEKEIQTVFEQGGRIITPYFKHQHPEFVLKTLEIMGSGLDNDQTLIHKGMKIVGNLPESYRSAFNLQKKQEMQTLIQNYLDILSNYLHEHHKPGTDILKDLDQFFQKNRNIKYFVAIPIAYIGAILGVFFLMPLVGKFTKAVEDSFHKQNMQEATNAQAG